MAIHIWRPDTCGCVFEFDAETVDPTIGLPASGDVVGGAACPIHAALTDPSARRDAVASENVTRQVALHAVAEALGWKPAVMHPRVPDVVLTPEQNPLFRPQFLPNGYDQNRQFVIYTADLVADGADEAVIAGALKSLPKHTHAKFIKCVVDRTPRLHLA